MYKKIIRLKILVLALAFLIFFGTAQKAVAQSADNTFSSSYVFATDLSAQVTFREEFVNSSDTSIIDKYRIIIPYSDAENVQINVNGQSVSTEVKSYEPYKEATVDLPNISSGQSVKVTTTFKTFLAAEDFGGMKTLTLASIDPKVTLRSQTLIIPSSFGEVSSISDDCEISYVATTNITCNSAGKIYVTTGEKFYFNFDLKQSLKNSSGKNMITDFLLPYEGFYQNLYFYESLSDVTAKKDEVGNLYLETKLIKGTQKEIEVSGILEGSSIYEFNSSKALTEETDVWDFSSNEIEEIFSTFDDEDKIQEIYSYIIDNYKATVSEKFSRHKVSEFAKKQDLTNIQFSDLAVALLRNAGVRAIVVIGENNGALATVGGQPLSSWVLYFDSKANVWKGMDPYFADSGQMGDHIFINPDRIAYFVIDGFEDDRLLDELTSINGSYVEIYPYVLDQELLSRPFNYTVKIIAPTKVSLNVDAEISLGLTNDSSQLIHPDMIYKGVEEIDIDSQDKNVWVLPSQSFSYRLKGIVLTGLLKTVSAELKLDYTIASQSNSQPGEISTEISAVPTLKTFLPYIFTLGIISVLSSGYFLFKSIRKRLNKAKN